MRNTFIRVDLWDYSVSKNIAVFYTDENVEYFVKMNTSKY